MNTSVAAEQELVPSISAEPIRPLVWIYRNLCWYGMQLERYWRRAKRRVRKILRPVGKLISSSWNEHVAEPVRSSAADIRGICTDSGRAFRLIGAASRRGGLRSFLAQSAHCAARGVSKYRSFLTGALNHCLPVLCVAVLLFTAFSLFSRDYALAIECGGAQVGYDADESTYFDATEEVGERIISTSEDFKNTLNLKVLYKKFKNLEQKAPLQFTAVWGCQDLFGAKGLRFSGFADVWWESKCVFLSEPQLWYAFGEHFNLGGEIELSCNFAGYDGFACRPCIGTKWVF